VRSRLKTHQKILIAATAAITLLLLLAVGVWAYDDAQKDQIAPGVKIGGVDIGGRDADSARKIIKTEVVAPLKQPVVVSYGGKDYTLTPEQLHATADVNGMVQEAIDRSRQGSILERVSRYATGSDVSANLEPRVRYDKSAVNDFVTQLSGQINQDPVDASVTPSSSGDKLIPEPGQDGLAVDEKAMRQQINEAARSPGRDQDFAAAVHQTKPEVTKKQLAKDTPNYILIDRNSFTLRYFHNLRLKKEYPIAVGQVGL